MKQIVLKSALLASIISLVSAQPALAYIDPNTGGMLFQALAASFTVLTGFALLFSRQIRISAGCGKLPLWRASKRRKIFASRPGRRMALSSPLARATSSTRAARCIK